MRMIIMLVGFVACAHGVRSDLPATSAASDRAAPGPAVSIATALHGDPPLPGQPTGAWVGLGNASSGGMAHHHMEGMNMDMNMGGMDMNMPGMDMKDAGHDAH